MALCMVMPGSAFGESNLDFFFGNTQKYKDVVIEEILSTNTIRLKAPVGEKGEVIQLIGLKSPAPPRKRKVDIDRDQYGFTKREVATSFTPIEETIFESARELLEGKRVRLEFDTEKNSEEFIRMAYVFLIKDDTFVNAEILRRGLAHLRIQPPNTKYADQLRAAYREAQREKRGLQNQ